MEYSSNDATWSTFADGTSALTSATVTGVANTTTYRFRVMARNDVADGVESCTFAVNIVPHTRERTTLGQVKPGASVNVEIDMLARYVARITGGS